MKHRPAVYLIVSLVLFFSSVMCTLSAPGNNYQQTKPVNPDLKATIAALQSTAGPVDLQATVKVMLAQTQTALPVSSQAPTSTGFPSAVATTPSDIPGSIAGKLSYPADSLPPLRIVAFRVEKGVKTKSYMYVEVFNQDTYLINNLKPGTYWVVAFPITQARQITPGLEGGYTKAVACGLSVNCTDHNLVEVQVKPGEVTNNIDPGDWFAPTGAFPKDPSIP
jgi:hypothetical protein